MKGYRKSPTLFRMVPSATPMTSSSPRLGFTTPQPKLQSLLSQERLKIFSAHSKTFRALIYKAYRAVIFTIIQLSC